jgi:outer membrane usher protein
MWIRWAAVAAACVILSTRIVAFPAAVDAAPKELWLAAELNGQQMSEVALYLRGPTDRILAPAAQLKAWRLRIPRHPEFSHNNEDYVPLDALPGLTYDIDEDKQVLVIRAPARLFEGIALNVAAQEAVAPPRPPPGGFLDYELVASAANPHSSLGALVEASLFGSAGAGVLQYLAKRESQQTTIIRLDSTWSIDHPDTANSFRLGDSITGASAWGGAVRFGGIQWASNYTTRPDLITMPLPNLSGEAALPSSLSLYVNNTLRLQNNLPSGPFRIEDVPVITGEGDVRLVVRDLLGREQVIAEPYYASPELLREGLQTYSLETGFERENYGISGNTYGRALMVATDRVGLTDWLTAEAHGELLRDQQTAGVSGAIRLSSLGVMDASIATSRDQQGEGQLLGLGFTRSARWLSFGGHVEYASRWFTRLGVLPGQPMPRVSTQLFASMGLGHLGSLSVSHTRQIYFQGHSLDILSARDNINVGWLGYLTVSLIRTTGHTADTTVALGLTHSINARSSASITTTADAAGTSADFELQQNLPAGRGVGYRLIADSGVTQAADGTLDLQTDVGNYELEVRRQPGSTLTQAFASGGIALLDGHLFPAREIEDSFAVVHVGTESHVRVYRENQLVGQTDASGFMLVPGLRAYQNNSIGIEQADLPLDAVVETLQAQATPYFRSGAIVRFPVEHPKGALLSVRLENGEPLPPGAMVRLVTQQTEFPSGMNGQVYVTGLTDRNELRAEWGGRSCSFNVLYSASADPLPRLGPFTCANIIP